MEINRTLPVEKFLDRQHIAAAGFFEREKPAANGCNHFGLAANYPAFRPRCRKIGKGERAAVGPQNILPWAGRSGHVVLELREKQSQCSPSNLKISLTKNRKGDALGRGAVCQGAQRGPNPQWGDEPCRAQVRIVDHSKQAKRRMAWTGESGRQ